jgi:hypothetical protein
MIRGTGRYTRDPHDPWGSEEETKVVTCDTCGASATRGSHDPGEASELARLEGFRTIRKGLGEPMGWACPKCHGGSHGVT